MDRDIERFPVEKKRIKSEEPPEFIFFDIDEDAEEAEFIRVDDLFRDEPDFVRPFQGPVYITIFPRKSGCFIDSRFSRVIRRTLALSALRVQKPLEAIRVRPVFVQWRIDLSDLDDPENIAREFRTDLEAQAKILKNMNDEERYWADSCFVWSAENRIPDNRVVQMAAEYQDEETREE